MTNLFGDEVSRRNGKAARPPADGVVKACFAAWAAGFAGRFNMPPIHPSAAKDGALFKKLAASLGGQDATTALIARFFASTHPRVVRSNYTVGEFFSLAQGLLIEDRQPRDERTNSNIDAATRATRRR